MTAAQAGGYDTAFKDLPPAGLTDEQRDALGIRGWDPEESYSRVDPTEAK